MIYAFDPFILTMKLTSSLSNSAIIMPVQTAQVISQPPILSIPPQQQPPAYQYQHPSLPPSNGSSASVQGSNHSYPMTSGVGNNNMNINIPLALHSSSSSSYSQNSTPRLSNERHSILNSSSNPSNPNSTSPHLFQMYSNNGVAQHFNPADPSFIGISSASLSPHSMTSMNSSPSAALAANSTVSQPEKKDFPKAQLHLSYLSKQVARIVTEQMIFEILNHFGHISQVVLKKSNIDRVAGIQTGYGFIYLPDNEEGKVTAQAIANALKKTTIHEIIFDCSLSNQMLSETLISQFKNKNNTGSSSSNSSVSSFGGVNSNITAPVPLNLMVPAPINMTGIAQSGTISSSGSVGSGTKSRATSSPLAASPLGSPGIVETRQFFNSVPGIVTTQVIPGTYSVPAPVSVAQLPEMQQNKMSNVFPAALAPTNYVSQNNPYLDYLNSLPSSRPPISPHHHNMASTQNVSASGPVYSNVPHLNHSHCNSTSSNIAPVSSIESYPPRPPTVIPQTNNNSTGLLAQQQQPLQALPGSSFNTPIEQQNIDYWKNNDFFTYSHSQSFSLPPSRETSQLHIDISLSTSNDEVSPVLVRTAGIGQGSLTAAMRNLSVVEEEETVNDASFESNAMSSLSND
jgi:hypothetical protein